MPAIKLKKKTQEYLEEKKREKEALEAATPAKTTPATTPPTPPKKKKEARAPQTPPAYLKENDILFEKRKRTIPVVEQKCQDWIMDNFEKKEEVHVSASKMYEYYTESVLQDAGNVADVGLFNRIVREKLGKYYGVKEMSPLHGIIKEIKPKEKKVQGETLSLKMKDILNEVITEVGNPNKGLRFFNLKQKVGSKYPALQVETYPNKLLNALDRGVRYGSIILVKGSGKCGYYRVPGESTAEEDKPKPKEKKNKGEVEEKEEEENGETGEVPETSGQEEKVKSKKRGKKRKSEEAEEDDGEGKDEQEGEEDSKAAKKKKKRRGKSRTSADRGKAARHGDPTKIEDTFPMALTYMCDPKEASIGKISKYINRYYPAVDTQAKLKKAMEKGESNGMWQLVGGQTYRLLLEEFNPGYSDDLEDMISQAVIATHEPKIASALMIKKYILQYHENFSVDSRPHLFRKALERACSRGIIRQISGLGCGGSFQLVKSFIPSPAILAGELEDEAEYLDDTVEPDGKDEIYIVRKTKSGRGTGTKERKERKPPASRK